MATANTGSVDIEGISANLKKIREEAEQIDKYLISSIVSFQDHLSTVKELSKQYQVYKDTVYRVSQVGTQIKHINDAILNVTENIGIRKIKDVELDKIARRINQESIVLQEEKKALEEKRNLKKLEIEDIEKKNQIEKNNLDTINNKIASEQYALTLAATKEEEEDIKDRIVLLEKEAKSYNDILQSLKESVDIHKNESTEAESTLKLIQKAEAALAGQNEKLNILIANQKNYNIEADKSLRKTQLLQRTFQALTRIPIIGPLLDVVDLAEKAEKGWGKAFPALGKQLKNIFTSQVALATMAVAAISGIYRAIKSVVTQVLEFDKGATAIANNMALSRESTRYMVSSLYNAGEAANRLDGVLDSSFINITNSVKAISALQEGFGTSAAFSEKMIQSQILLTEQMGLANEEAIEIQKFQFLAGVGAKDFLDSVTKQVSQQERLNRVSLSYRKVISEVSKVSAEISASYKNNPKFLIEAVIQAQKLGMTLEQTRKISESLLNFESSIENELKAELLIGKSLNYEKARSLALDGKSAEAAAELVNQMGGLQGITNLNVIQRKALAESIGMSSEELVKAAQQEEILKKIGESSLDNLKERYSILVDQGKRQEAQNLLAEIQKHQNGEILAQDIAKADLNKRFEQTLNKIKQIFVDIGQGPILKIVEGIASFLQDTGRLKVILIAVSGIATAIAAALTAAAIAAAFASGGVTAIAAAATLGIGASAGMAYLLNSSTAAKETPSSNFPNPTNAIQPAINPPGPAGPVESLNDAALSPKGDVMISTPEGNMFKVGERDYIYTTPMAPDEMMNATAGGVKTSGYDRNQVKDDESVSLLREMVVLLKSKGYVYMDSRVVGETLGQSTTSFA